MTNPLGVYFYNGNLTIKSNVTIQGTLICKGDLVIDGTNVHFEPVEMPGLFGAGTTSRLPAIICKNLTIKTTLTSGNVDGLIAVFDTFTFNTASETQTFPIVGRVITNKFYINPRQPWDTTNWSLYYFTYWNYYRSSIPYFPVYMAIQGRNYQPLLTIKPDTASITYHWPMPNSSVALVNTTDGALRWEVIKWTETP